MLELTVKIIKLDMNSFLFYIFFDMNELLWPETKFGQYLKQKTQHGTHNLK